MAIISKKKVIYKVHDKLDHFMHQYNRISPISIHYEDLVRYQSSIPLYDKEGEDTLWYSVFYGQEDMEDIHNSLKMIYSSLRLDGNISLMEHLYIDRVDVCSYGNTQPFRIRIVNKVNDNFDYFYVKKADASRIYGLELEDILSPNRVNYFVSEQTLIEEHIPGIPGDMFINEYLEDGHQNKTRLAKEFIKFNERCFVQLLGDMHSSNWVVNVIPDFDEVNYRIRPIDFDQQSYEGRKNIYLPQFYKQNTPILKLGMGKISWESVRQYQAEERYRISSRLVGSKYRTHDLLKVMKTDQISPQKNVDQLKNQLADHYTNDRFKLCKTMGEIVNESLEQLLSSHDKGLVEFKP